MIWSADALVRTACEGSRWEIELWATDIDQAQRKLAAIAGGKIDGQVFGKVEA